MIPNSGMTRRPSSRIRKTRRAYSPSTNDDTPSTSSKSRIRGKSRHIPSSISRSLSSSSSEEITMMEKKAIISQNLSSDELPISKNPSLPSQAMNDKECGNIVLNHNSFWNFAVTLSHPITHEKIASDKIIPLVLKEVSRAIRQLIFGAKLVMQQAKRQKLLCDDLNAFIEMNGGKLLFGFMEDNRWQKIGDVFVPCDEILDLRFCSASVQLETLSAK
ncbi:Inactive tyrosine-protein kinase [Dirofilaria immitis]